MIAHKSLNSSSTEFPASKSLSMATPDLENYFHLSHAERELQTGLDTSTWPALNSSAGPTLETVS
jgi:hypothetical protein